MKRNLTLFILFSIMYFKVFRQNNIALPQPKFSAQYENVLDSAGSKKLNKFKIVDTIKPAIRVTCGCPRNANKPLFLIKAHNKIFVLDSLSMLNPSWIDDIHVAKDSSLIAQYGTKAKDGVIIITINEKYHPEAYKELKHKLRKFRPASN
jgi:hypothetical protein